jgi:hypothetical protein
VIPVIAEMRVSVATEHNLIHLQRFHRGPVTRPLVLFDTSPLGSRDVDAAVRGALAARAVPGQPVRRQKVSAAGQDFGR